MALRYPIYRCPLCRVALAWGDGHVLTPGVCKPSATNLDCEGRFEHPEVGDCANVGNVNLRHDDVDADRASSPGPDGFEVEHEGGAVKP